MKLTIKIKEPFTAIATVTHTTGMKPFVSDVDHVAVSIDGWEVDITEQVVASQRALKKLEARVLEEYKRGKPA